MADNQYMTLNNGVNMPMVGFGTWTLKGQQGKKIILDALAAGYRLIDTAHMYGNEDIVGQAVAESGIPREEIFITTKLCGTRAGYKLACQGIEESLNRLQTDYIDLLLIHEPYAEAAEMYCALTEAYRSGKVRAIGISNFNAREYLTFIETCGIIPMVNQVECHVYYRRKELQQILEAHGTKMQAWSPLYRRAETDIQGTCSAGCGKEIRKNSGSSSVAVPDAAGTQCNPQNIPQGTYD